MAKKKRKAKKHQERQVTDAQVDANVAYNQKALTAWLNADVVKRNYIPLVESPEVKAGVEKIAEIVSLMTIHLMENSESGDKRIINELSKKIDIYPNKYVNRQMFISWIVQEMLLYGNAIVLPKILTRGGKTYIDDLIQIPYRKRTINDSEDGYGYYVDINSNEFDEEEILNFRLNPDMDRPWVGASQEVILRDFIDNLGQANLTTKDFMENKMLPNVIVKVSGLTGDMDNEEGRNEIENRFLSRAKSGQPWIIPSELMQIEQIKPTTLQDIAIDKTIKINKESVASILGIPAFLLGVGTFNKEEYNNFVKTKVSIIAKSIEQELTRKLIIKDDWYFKFNISSLLSYDLIELAKIYSDLYTKGLVTGNEVRDKLGISTLDELNELVILENYIPIDKIGDQEKLVENNEAKEVNKEDE